MFAIQAPARRADLLSEQVKDADARQQLWLANANSYIDKASQLAEKLSLAKTTTTSGRESSLVQWGNHSGPRALGRIIDALSALPARTRSPPLCQAMDVVGVEHRLSICWSTSRKVAWAPTFATQRTCLDIGYAGVLGAGRWVCSTGGAALGSTRTQ